MWECDRMGTKESQVVRAFKSHVTSDLEAECGIVLDQKLIQGFPLNKIFGQPSVSVPPEKLS